MLFIKKNKSDEVCALLRYSVCFLFFLLIIYTKAQTYIDYIGKEQTLYNNAVYDGNNRIYSTNFGKICVTDTNGRIIRNKYIAINGDSSFSWTTQLITKKGVLVLLANKVVTFLDTNLNQISWTANFPSGTFLRSAAEIDNNHVYVAVDNISSFYKIRISDAAEIKNFKLKKSIYVPRSFHVDPKNGDLLMHMGGLWRFDTLGNEKSFLNFYHTFAWFTSDTTFVGGNDIKNTIIEYSITGRQIVNLTIKRFGIVSNLYKPSVVFKTPGGNYLVLNSTEKTSTGGYIYKFSSTGNWLNTIGRPVTVSTNGFNDKILPTPELLSLDKDGNLYVMCGLNNNDLLFGPVGLSRGAISSFTPDFRFRYSFEFTGNIEHFSFFKNQIFVQSDGKFQAYDSNLNAVGSYINSSYCGEFVRDEAENIYFAGHRTNPGYEITNNFVFLKNNKYGTFPQNMGKTGYSISNGEINYATSIARLKNGNFVVADLNQNQVHMLDKDGKHLLFIAGYGGHPENICLPSSITTDQYDNIFISEAGNNRIKILNKDGKLIYNLNVFGPDGEQFNSPSSIVIDTLRSVLYVADRNNSKIRVFKLNYPLKGYLKTNFVNQTNLKIYPNPAKDMILIESNNVIDKYTISDISGRIMLSENLKSESSKIDISMLIAGTYFISIYTNNGLQTQKLIVL
ncbi:MAG: T9SS type A sorting domain-containing protein [Bacteroidia bacterium]|nr:T9SS type A sorting domain-containing protein [Bacteroidia bacterium]